MSRRKVQPAPRNTLDLSAWPSRFAVACYSLVAAPLLLLGLSVIAPHGYLRVIATTQTTTPTPSVAQTNPYALTDLHSRAWIEYVMDLVREAKTPPPTAARAYAYVASVYADVLDKTHDAKQASAGVGRIIDKLFPDRKTKTEATLLTINGGDAAVLSSEAAAIVSDYESREAQDGLRDLTWDGSIPTGDGKWVKTDKDPMLPKAGEWQRWLIGQHEDFEVPAPPEFNSDTDKAELQLMIESAASRNPGQIHQAMMWAGGAGTETPAGIWLNRLYEIAKVRPLEDQAFANEQKYLAQGMADAFMECWRVKFTYWTARPSMRIADFKTVLPNPPFPSYVSGHSTISRTAAEVLSHYYPELREEFIREAEFARDSRLYAGIHFNTDNIEGFKLGEKIGAAVVKRIP